MPFRVDVTERRRYLTFAVVAASYLNHLVSGLYATAAIDGGTKIGHRQSSSKQF
jgi:hypothetical protein